MNPKRVEIGNIMKIKRLTLLTILAALTCVLTAVDTQAQNSSVFATGLKSPTKVITTARGNLLVAEADAPLNSGQITLVHQTLGARLLISGLPSGLSAEGGGDGVTGLLLEDNLSTEPVSTDNSSVPEAQAAEERQGRTLLILIGIGDVARRGTAPGTEVPNPAGPASPILSSLLVVNFNREVDSLAGGFTLTLADHFRLADGLKVTKETADGGRATIELLTDFRDLVPDSRTIIRASHPFGMVRDRNNVYVVDSGYNSVVKVNINTGRTQTLTTFAPLPNPRFPQMGGPVTDAVPTSIRLFGDQLLVTLFGGFPFAPGASQIRSVDPTTGISQPFITNLTSAMDVLPVRDANGTARFFVLELSTDLTANAPGRLRRFDSPTATPAIVAPVLIGPSSMAVDPNSADIFVSEIFTGRIIRLLSAAAPPPNSAPVVTITSPANGSVFTTLDMITVVASASSAGGSITKVEFYSGDFKLNEDTTAPYTYSQGNVNPGTYTVTAVATNDRGVTTRSSPVIVIVR